jgi:hypothetical protein
VYNSAVSISEAIRHLPLTAESRVRSRIGPCDICGGQSGTGTVFSPSSSAVPFNFIPLWFSVLIYHLGDEK